MSCYLLILMDNYNMKDKMIKILNQSDIIILSIIALIVIYSCSKDDSSGGDDVVVVKPQPLTLIKQQFNLMILGSQNHRTLTPYLFQAKCKFEGLSTSGEFELSKDNLIYSKFNLKLMRVRHYMLDLALQH